MEWFQALILGIVQGLTEYLPVSSSGHLEIFKDILGIELPADENLQFDVVVHAATVLSTIVVLWPMFRDLCRSFFTFRRDENTTYVWKLIVSCIPVGIVGVFFKSYVEEIFGSGLLIVGICLCVTAALLLFAHLSDVRAGKLKRAGSEPQRYHHRHRYHVRRQARQGGQLLVPDGHNPDIGRDAAGHQGYSGS